MVIKDKKEIVFLSKVKDGIKKICFSTMNIEGKPYFDIREKIVKTYSGVSVLVPTNHGIVVGIEFVEEFVETTNKFLKILKQQREK